MTTTVEATPATVNLTAYRGDSWSQTFRFLADGQPVDLTSLQLQAAARNTLGQVSELVVSVADPASGSVQISLPEGGLPPDLYDYDLEADDQGAITTWVRGRLRIERDVTSR